MPFLDAARPAPVAPGGIPGLGHLLPLVGDPAVFLHGLRAYGDLAAIRVGTSLIHVLNSPELVHRVLVTHANDFDKGRLFERARPVLGDGLLASNGDYHKQQRRLLQPAFHRRNIPSWARLTEAETAAMCDAWRPGDVVDVVRWTRTLATRIVIRTLFTAEPGDRTIAKINHALPVLLRGFIPRLLRPDGRIRRLPTPGSIRFDRAAQELRGALDGIIATRRRDATSGDDLLSLLCRPKPGVHSPLTDAQIRDEAVTMLLAGVETTGTVLAWLLYELHRHPDIRSRMKREIDAAGTYAASSEEQAPYLHNILKETLRLHTPTWVLTRRTRTPFRHGGIRVPAGADIVFSPLALHSDSRLYPNPQSFDPDRWEKAPAPPRGAFVPFGAGVHKCIGEGLARTEIAVAISVIHSSWTLSATSGSTAQPSKYLGTHQPRRLRMTVERGQRQP
ncbi:cytochrome P450 [Streptomyces sp. 8N114]|uniref:cytochrome P450 n=1 Tax=Streptomyces sp. 8N114 TaxID=3457419 RepID=UPI003FD274B3